MAEQWETKRILITVKTYPTPAWKGGEVVCTAGVTDQGEWIRLFPIPFRTLLDEQQFKKYQWIEARIRKATNDLRRESYNIDVDSIRILDAVGSEHRWAQRKRLVLPLAAQSLCSLRAQRDQAKLYPTLGLFRPRSIERFWVRPVKDADWKPDELARLLQANFISGAIQQLEKVPFTFGYDLHCEEATCNGHSMSCTDWELYALYRKLARGKAQTDWEPALRQTYDRDVRDRFDSQFFVGTVHQYPENWLIIGLWRPPKEPEPLSGQATQAALPLE